MRKFSVLTQIHYKPVKRSLTMEQVEVLFLMAMNTTFEKHRNYFNMTFTLPNGQYNKAVTVKKIPLGYLNKFEIKK
jgi:hypothetical protein